MSTSGVFFPLNLSPKPSQNVPHELAVLHQYQGIIGAVLEQDWRIRYRRVILGHIVQIQNIAHASQVSSSKRTTARESQESAEPTSSFGWYFQVEKGVHARRSAHADSCQYHTRPVTSQCCSLVPNDIADDRDDLLEPLSLDVFPVSKVAHVPDVEPLRRPCSGTAGSFAGGRLGKNPAERRESIEYCVALCIAPQREGECEILRIVTTAMEKHHRVGVRFCSGRDREDRFPENLILFRCSKQQCDV
ncbi:unnamed protein product [Clonostachys rhizophaga]|uniref:Uncharacterized protein n=1 Tax=Clonostachys rhizophaga TaxID=160324 RepID=A0A9N9V1S7_9HYPO|nr:unnamed protein product [Clonostachys rhizophaga]